MNHTHTHTHTHTQTHTSWDGKATQPSVTQSIGSHRIKCLRKPTTTTSWLLIYLAGNVITVCFIIFCVAAKHVLLLGDEVFFNSFLAVPFDALCWKLKYNNKHVTSIHVISIECLSFPGNSYLNFSPSCSLELVADYILD